MKLLHGWGTRWIAKRTSAMPFRFVPSDGMSGWIGEKLIPHPTSLRMMVWVMRGDMSGLQPSSF